jgi:hypothetical protein
VGVIAAAAGAMLVWTWGTWAAPIVDFGGQLYTAWQLSAGKVLYRDVAFYNGPLSQYVNSLWFRLFGVSLRTLVLCNLAIAGVLTLLIHAVLRRVAGPLAAEAGCLVFVLLFALAGFTMTGNYNYLCPYSHEMTHGVLLSLLALLCVWGYRRWGLAALAGGGVALGLTFLTKAEVFVAAAAGCVAALTLTLWAERPTWQRGACMAGTFAVGALVPPACAFALLRTAMPASAALTGTLGSWVVATNPQLTAQPFYQDLTGLSDAGGNLWLLLRQAGFYGAVLILAGLIAWGVARLKGRRGSTVQPARRPEPAPGAGSAAGPVSAARALAAGGVFCVTAATLYRFAAPMDWVQAGRPLPLFMLVVGAVLLAQFVRRKGDLEARRRAMRRASLVVLALALMGKMILAVWIGHYGFVLAMPATMVLVVLLLDWLPAALRPLRCDATVMAAAGVGMLVPAVVAMLGIQGSWIERRTCEVAPGTLDAFRCEPGGQCLNDFVREFSARAAPGQTLAVMPEGAMLNYLCRRESSVPYPNYLPLEMALYGEEAMLAALQAHPPDWIALTNRSMEEYGVQWFTRDYGRAVGAWLAVNYGPAATIGAPVFEGKDFGILLLKRNQ